MVLKDKLDLVFGYWVWNSIYLQPDHANIQQATVREKSSFAYFKKYRIYHEFRRITSAVKALKGEKPPARFAENLKEIRSLVSVLTYPGINDDNGEILLKIK